MTTIAPGTFSPAPRRASRRAMIYSQGRIEAKLMLRHGEQLLLNLVIPVAVLIAASLMPVLGDDTGGQEIFPMVLALAATSSGFTGQAIAVAFDRRYGALKRSGASGVPAGTIIGGKIIGVGIMVVVQLAVLTALALILGWRTGIIGVLFGLLTLAVGVAAFTALGLLMGGTLSSELVLGLANLVWLILGGVVGWVVYAPGLEAAGWFNLVPSVALASGLTEAFNGAVPWAQLLILVVFGAAASAAAVKWFRFES